MIFEKIRHSEKKTMVLIGLIGKKGSGKDTTADFLTGRYGFIKRAYADPLKKVCKELFLLEDGQVHDPVLKEKIDPRWDMTPRQMMQWMGTDIVRSQLGKDFWVRHMDMFRRLHPTQDIVVTDVRFQNEADWITKNGGVLCRVNRPDSSSDHDLHPSEKELENITSPTHIHILPNTFGTIHEYHTYLEKFFHQLLYTPFDIDRLIYK